MSSFLSEWMHKDIKDGTSLILWGKKGFGFGLGFGQPSRSDTATQENERQNTKWQRRRFS